MTKLKVSKAEAVAGLLTLAGVVSVVLESDVLPHPWAKVVAVCGAVALYLARSPLLGGKP